MPLIIDPNEAPAEPSGGAGAAPGGLVKNTDTANFAVDVIAASQEAPVIVDFWAPWCGPCKQLGPLLEKLVTQAAGAVRLVKINVDENQDLAAQMRIQSIPAVYAFKDGQPVDGFVGAQTESQIREFIGRLTGGAKSPLDEMLEQAMVALDAGDVDAAGALFSQVLSQDPANPTAVAGVIRCSVAAGRLDHAKEVLSHLPPEVQKNADVAAAISAMELAEQSDGSADIAELEARSAADPADNQARFDLGVALYGAGNAEAAIDALVEIVRREREWNEGAARQQLIKIFDALGGADPITVAGRRKLSTILFS